MAVQPKPIFDAGAAAAQELLNVTWTDALDCDLTLPFLSNRPQAMSDMEARF
jgi:hypothetical protein